jgi:hypothetical protein
VSKCWGLSTAKQLNPMIYFQRAIPMFGSGRLAISVINLIKQIMLIQSQNDWPRGLMVKALHFGYEYLQRLGVRLFPRS